MGKSMSEEHKRKIAEKLKGNNNAKKSMAVEVIEKPKSNKVNVHTINMQKEFQKLSDPFQESGLDVIEPKYLMDGFGYYFEKNEYHAAACKFKTDAVAGQGYEIQPVDDTIKDKDAEYSKLKQFIENANPDESFENVIKKCWLDYEVFGNFYMELDKNIRNELVAIGHLPANTVRKAGSKNGYYQLYDDFSKGKYFDKYGYIDSPNYAKELSVYQKQVTEIIHLKNYYYESSYYGYPDVLPALGCMYLDLHLIDFNTYFFENNAIPEGILLFTNTEVDSETMAKIQEYHVQKFKGKENQHRLLVLQAEGQNAKVEFVDLSGGEKDLSFERLHKMCRDRVLSAHRLPPKIAGTITAGELGQSNQSYAEMQMFQELIIKPRQRQLEFMLNKVFNTYLGIKNWKLVFTGFDYVPDIQDADFVMKLWNNGSGIITREEARIFLNYSVTPYGKFTNDEAQNNK